jgi:hypothetical protein
MQLVVLKVQYMVSIVSIVCFIVSSVWDDVLYLEIFNNSNAKVL